jgi:hypothetical protein
MDTNRISILHFLDFRLRDGYKAFRITRKLRFAPRNICVAHLY